MTCAYDRSYLEDAMGNLGDMMDYAANDCGMDKDEFFQLFITSGLADSFGRGEPRLVAGKSGAELAQEVFWKVGLREIPGRRVPGFQLPSETAGFAPMPEFQMEKRPDYWCGWILAYYQWETGQRFEDIHRKISFREIERLYPTLHEAPEQKFVEVLKHRMKEKNQPTRLQVLRKTAGLTQAELSKRSQVSLRSIQMYEQRKKDVNKAQAITLHQLAAAIGCRLEDLLEL
ncbi:MAG: helix-turn-helix transcriptional regulator [Lachnospiraceae bacterium]|nr:helix-turn-helix transcriptional regulator [Lachnospiraceae bacterium]